jgi:allophanate hydrolase subunit 2
VRSRHAVGHMVRPQPSQAGRNRVLRATVVLGGAFDASAANLVENRRDVPVIDMSTKNVPLLDIANGNYVTPITR